MTYNSERGSRALGADRFFSAANARLFDNVFQNIPEWKTSYLEHLPQLTHSLSYVGLPMEARESFILELAKIDTIGRLRVHGLLKRTAAIISELAPVSPQIATHQTRLLLDTLARDAGYDLLHGESFQTKIVHMLASRKETVPFLFLWPNSGKEARQLDEKECIALSMAIEKSVGQATGQLGIHPFSSTLDCYFGKQSKSIHADFFAGKHGMEYVRVGHLFLIDEKIVPYIPQQVWEKAGGNIICIPSLSKTEFGNRLGYFTANTIGALLMADIRGKTVVDCGTGGGILCAVAKKLGAALTIGVDTDEHRLQQATALFQANGYQEKDGIFLSADIRDTSQIITALKKRTTSFNPLTVISNIGHWEDYPITNLSSILLGSDMRAAGYQIESIVCGGYSNCMTKTYRSEMERLKKLGIFKYQLPYADKEADTMVLKKEGFTKKGNVQSEDLYRPGEFGYSASSFIVHI